MLITDEYGRPRIVAPEGKVLKGYLVDDFGHIEHCLVDQWGLVYAEYGSGYAWSDTQCSSHARLVAFPNPVEPANGDNSPWTWEDWYERNWLCDSWAWMYCKAASWRDLKELRKVA